MAYLTCFSWSHCSRTVHGNMKGRTMHGREQRASLDTQTRTHPNKNSNRIKAYAHLCSSEGLLTKCVFLSVWRPYNTLLCSLSKPLCPHISSPFFPFLLETRDTPSIFILLPRPANAIWAKNRKQTKGPKKKVKLLIWCQCQLEGREERSNTQRSRRKRKEAGSELLVSQV